MRAEEPCTHGPRRGGRVAGCTWIATYGVTNDGGSVGDFVTVEGRNFTASPNDVEVRERDITGAAVDGAGFDIEVLCPNSRKWIRRGWGDAKSPTLLQLPRPPIDAESPLLDFAGWRLLTARS